MTDDKAIAGVNAATYTVLAVARDTSNKVSAFTALPTNSATYTVENEASDTTAPTVVEWSVSPTAVAAGAQVT